MPLYNHWITEETKDGVEKREPLWLLQGGGSGEWKWIVRDFGVDIYTLIYFKRITNKDLRHNTWNSAQCFVGAWMGGEFGREWTHVWLSPFAVHMKMSQHC